MRSGSPGGSSASGTCGRCWRAGAGVGDEPGKACRAVGGAGGCEGTGGPASVWRPEAAAAQDEFSRPGGLSRGASRVPHQTRPCHGFAHGQRLLPGPRGNHLLLPRGGSPKPAPVCPHNRVCVWGSSPPGAARTSPCPPAPRRTPEHSLSPATSFTANFKGLTGGLSGIYSKHPLH